MSNADRFFAPPERFARSSHALRFLRRKPRSHLAPALAGWIAACGALALGCGEAAVTPRATAATEPAPSAFPTPQLALGLQPDGTTPTGRQVAAAQQALRDNPEELSAYTALAAALLKRRRETSNAVFATYAQDVLQAASARAPADPRVRLLGTMVLLEQHRFAAAAERARALTVVLPHDPTPQLLLGDALLELGEYEPAADAFQAAMNLRPDLRSYNRAAHMRWLYGDFEGARQILDLAIDAGSSRDPEGQAWCFADLGTMYLARGDGRRAQASADRALQLLPEYIPGLVVAARAQALQGRIEDAIATLRGVVRRRASVQDLLTLATWLNAAGQTDEATRRRQQAQEMSEDDPRPMAHFLARRGEQPQRALRLAELELRARHNIAAHDTHALALLRSGRAADAQAAIDRALRLGTQDPELWLHAAMIAAATGDAARARSTLDRALALDPGVDAPRVTQLRTTLGAT